jgi:acyl-CoA thioester hydrolase
MSDDWHSLPVRIYYEDTDAQGVVYFANYQRFMERGRTEWLRARGVSQSVLRQEHGLFFSLVTTSVHYRQPAMFDQQVLVLTRVDEIRGARVLFRQEVRLQETNALLCSAESVAACLDEKQLRPRRLPQSLQLLMQVEM